MSLVGDVVCIQYLLIVRVCWVDDLLPNACMEGREKLRIYIILCTLLQTHQ